VTIFHVFEICLQSLSPQCSTTFCNQRNQFSRSTIPTPTFRFENHNKFYLEGSTFFELLTSQASIFETKTWLCKYQKNERWDESSFDFVSIAFWLNILELLFTFQILFRQKSTYFIFITDWNPRVDLSIFLNCVKHYKDV